MFQTNDEQYLLNAISANKDVFFLGAGFTHDVKNQYGEGMPLANRL